MTSLPKISTGFAVTVSIIVALFVLFIFLPVHIADMAWSRGQADLRENENKIRASLERLQIKDPALRGCIDEAARILYRTPPGSSGYVTDVTQVTRLACERKGIVSLEGIEGLPALEYLLLADNKVGDAAPVAALHHLRSLDLTRNQVKELSVLYAIPHLEFVSLDGNPVTDLAPLASLRSLRHVTVPSNGRYRCEDIRYLAAVPYLREVGLPTWSQCEEPDFTDASLPGTIDCTANVSAGAQQLCRDDQLLALDRRLYDLHARAVTRSRAPDQLAAEYGRWLSRRDACDSHGCLLESYYGELAVLEQVVRARQPCLEEDGLPLIAHDSSWSTAMANGEPADRLVRLGAPAPVYFHSTVLGAAGRTTVFHRWYLNGKQVAEQRFEANGWKRLTSSVLPVDTLATLEVKVVDSRGCLLRSSLLPVGGEHRVEPLLAAKSDERSLKDALELLHDMPGTDLLRRRDTRGDTLLLSAVRQDDTVAVQKLLEAGASPFVWDPEGRTPLELARAGGNKPMIALLDHTVSTTVPPWAVTYAVITDRVLADEPQGYLLLVNQQDKPVFAFARIADAAGHQITHRWLTDGKPLHEETMRAESDSWPSVSEFRVPPGTALWTVEIAIDGKLFKTINFRSDTTRAPEHPAEAAPREIKQPTASALRHLAEAWAPRDKLAPYLKANGPLNPRDDRDLLEQAVESGNIGMLHVLASHGLSPLDFEDIGTPMLKAIEAKRRDMVSYLLAAGIPADTREPANDQTPLFRVGDNVAFATELLDYGADPNALDKSRLTPLHAAAGGCHPGVTHLLLARGASRELKGQTGMTAFDYAWGNCGHHAPWEELRPDGRSSSSPPAPAVQGEASPPAPATEAPP